MLNVTDDNTMHIMIVVQNMQCLNTVTSFYSGMYGSGVWPQRCVPMAKKELRLAGPVGWASWITGTVFIDRLNPDKAKDTIHNAVQYMKDKNVSAKSSNLQS